MTRDEVYEKLTGIFRKVFDDDQIVIDDMTTAGDIEDWDSFEHINLMCAVEDAFLFKMSMEQALTLKNVGEIVDIILEKEGNK